MANGVMPGAKYTLYVEDEITRRYLNVLQPNRRLVYVCVVGGRERVMGCLEDDFRSGVTNSLGVVDRDFDRQAKSGWCSTSAGMRFFCLPAHEIENYLLDFEIIGQFKSPKVDPHKPASHWRTIARTIAEEYLYSVAYNQVLADLRREYLQNYPSHIKLSSGPGRDFSVTLPGEQIASEADLVRKLQNDTWLSTAIERSGQAFDLEKLEQQSADTIAYYQGLLNGEDDKWIRGFPGKEMYRAISNSMSLTDEQWLDLARFVAERQLAESKIPEDTSELLRKMV